MMEGSGPPRRKGVEIHPHPARPQAPDAETVGAKHRTVMYLASARAPAGIAGTKNEARRRAEEALIRIKGGETFWAVVAQCSDEPGAAARCGDLGNFRPSSMVPELASAGAERVGEIDFSTGFG